MLGHAGATFRYINPRYVVCDCREDGVIASIEYLRLLFADPIVEAVSIRAVAVNVRVSMKTEFWGRFVVKISVLIQ